MAYATSSLLTDNYYGFLLLFDKRTSAKHCPRQSKHLLTSEEDVFLRVVFLETAVVVPTDHYLHAKLKVR